MKRSVVILSAVLTGGPLLGWPILLHAQDMPAAAPSRADTAQAADRQLGPPVERGWVVDVIGRAEATFTDNSYLTTLNRKSDYVFSPAAGIEARQLGARSAISASVEVAHDFYANASDLNGPRIKALVDGTVGLSDDPLSVRGRLATNLQSSSQLGIVPATTRTVGGNQVQVLTYGIAPKFRQELSQIVVSEASYDLSGVAFLRAPTGSTPVAASDSLRQRAYARLSNDNPAALIEWDLTGAYQHQNLANGAASSQRANGEAGGEFRLTTTFALLARGGYEWVDEPTFNDKLDGLYGLGGFLLRPNSRTSLRVEAGYRYRKPNVSGELKYSQSDRLVMAASFDQGVETSQGILNGAFDRIERDPLGNLIDPLTGSPADPQGSAFDLSNQAFRYSRVRFGLQGALRRSFYNVTADYERRSINSVRGESWGGQVTLGRQLTPRLTATVEGRYVKTTSPTLTANSGLNAETKVATARLSYRMSETLTGGLRYAHLDQATRRVDYRENAVVLSLTKRF